MIKYAAKFEELAKFYPHYAAWTTEFSKCVKFENGFHTEIKRVIGYQQICKFPELVNGCRIYEEDTKTHYKMVSEKRGKQQNRGNRIVPQLIKVNRRLRRARSQVGEMLPLESHVLNVVKLVIVSVSA